MKKKGTLYSCLVLVAIVAFTIGAKGVYANLVLTVDDTSVAGIEVIIADGQAAGVATAAGFTTHADTDGVAGAISTGIFATADWSFNVTTGISNPITGNQEIDLSSIDVSSDKGGTLILSLTDNNFTAFGGGPNTISDAIGGTTDGTVDAVAYYGDADIEFETDAADKVVLGTFNVAMLEDQDFSGSGSTVVAADGGTFSLTKVVTITHAGAGNTSFNNDLSAVPEPGIALLLGMGLVGMVGVGRTRRFKGAKKE
jgi:hypothetical protein